MRTIFLLFLVVSIGLSAKTIDGYVCDINGMPLQNVLIEHSKSNQKFFSNNQGYFVIEGNDNDTIVFTFEGYSPSEFTVKNIIKSENKIYLFPQLEYSLPEVMVIPADMYDLYEKASINLKNRLIRDKEISYKCVGVEKEINIGDKRSTIFLFTTKLVDANPKKENIRYNFLLSKLEIESDTQKSDIMRDNKFRINLFSQYLKRSIRKSDKNQILISDSTIVIYDKSDPTEIATYTINRTDTTVMQITYEMAQIENDYAKRRTFKAKNLYFSISIEYTNREGGYYLSSQYLNYDTSFLTGKPEREERLICTYKIESIPDLDLSNKMKFIPKTQDLYKMPNFE